MSQAVQSVTFHRRALCELVRTDGSELWLASPQLQVEAIELLLPDLQKARVRVLTDLTAGRIASGAVEVRALQLLQALPGCEIRHLPGLKGAVYASLPLGPALVTSAALTLHDLDQTHRVGTLLPDAAPVVGQLQEWWRAAVVIGDSRLSELFEQAAQRVEAESVGRELARIGAFIRVSVRGTRRTRRLDPKEFGAGRSDWGRRIRPVEISLYRLDDLIRAKEELEMILADRGLEWNGWYLVPRSFLEQDWPRLFNLREQHLWERLRSGEGVDALRAQLTEARRELEAFFRAVYQPVQEPLAEEAWVDLQVTQVLAESVSESILAESSLEYRVLTILPEDERSVTEMQRLLQDPKLRSVQLTFPF
jgi:hypothetical protein